MVIGGAEISDAQIAAEAGIFARFVALAGGAKARIAVLGTGGGGTDRFEDRWVEAFARRGAAHADVLRVRTRAEANDEAVTAAVEQCTGVVLAGDDQVRIATALGGSRLDSVLHARLERGELVLAGVGAGAAMMPGTAITDGGLGMPSASVRTGPGLEFLSGVVIDMHFAARGRLDRLLSAIALFPHELGLGIDQDTAIVVKHGQFEVIGAGAVTVVDAGRADMIRAPAAGDGPIALSGVRTHVLPAGYSFELTERRPVDAPAGTQDWGMAG
jgi:cyanophycinase